MKKFHFSWLDMMENKDKINKFTQNQKRHLAVYKKQILFLENK